MSATTLESGASSRLHPLPRLLVREQSSQHGPMDGSSRSRSPTRRGASQSPRARVPSPLRHAQFRPLAMEYAASPQPTSCTYYNASEDEDLAAGGAPGGYCSAVRTVGYSTVGGKAFMSGKCPHCKRDVKSETQICTPNATPPPSPWRNLQSPLRSPLRNSPKNGQATLQSPLRSPFKESFFGSAEDSNKVDSSANDKSLPSPKRKTTADAATTTASTNSPRSKSPASRSPARSPFTGSSFFGSSKNNEDSSKTAAMVGPALRREPRGRSADTGTRFAEEPRSTSVPNIKATGPATRGRGPRSPSPVRSGTGVPSSNRRTRSPSPVRSGLGPSSSDTRGPRSLSPVGNMSSTAISRGPRSPKPRSPIRSPWRGASFFDNDDQMPTSKPMGKTRGVHSPGPRSPLRVKVDFVDEDEEAEKAERLAAAEAASAKKWKSPIRSPFKGSFFGTNSRKKAGAAGTEGTE